jgi:hypothetical protein
MSHRLDGRAFVIPAGIVLAFGKGCPKVACGSKPSLWFATGHALLSKFT